MKGKAGIKGGVLAAVFAKTSIFATAAHARSHKGFLEVEGDWAHLSGMTFPAELAGYSRQSLADYSVVSVADMVAEYKSADGQTTILVYAFHPGVGNSAVLADFSLQWWQARGAVTSGAPADFTLSNGKHPNGWRFTTSVQNTSVASALVQGGDWIYKVTVILLGQPAADPNEVLDRAVSALAWPESAQRAVQQPLPQPCPDKGQPDPEAALREQVSLDELKASVSYAREWNAYCRGPWFMGSGIYRPANGEDGYIIVRDESGIGFLIHPNETGDNQGFSVTLRRATEHSLFLGFEAEPTPEQIVSVVQGRGAVARLTLDTQGEMISASHGY